MYKQIMIVGHARSGKDTFADFLCEYTGRTKWSSSHCAIKNVILPLLESMYTPDIVDHVNYLLTLDESVAIEWLYENRFPYRSAWKDAITAYNANDKTRLMRKLYAEASVYVGCRSISEFEAGREEFDYLTIWVDKPGIDPEVTNDISYTDCDVIVINDAGLVDLKTLAINVAKLYNLGGPQN